MKAKGAPMSWKGNHRFQAASQGLSCEERACCSGGYPDGRPRCWLFAIPLAEVNGFGV